MGWRISRVLRLFISRVVRLFILVVRLGDWVMLFLGPGSSRPDIIRRNFLTFKRH